MAPQPKGRGTPKALKTGNSLAVQWFAQTHVHQVGDAIQPSHPLSSPSPPAPNPSQLAWTEEPGGLQSTELKD